MSGAEFLAVIVVLGLVIAAVVTGIGRISSNDGASKRALKRNLLAKTKELTIATKALNNIAQTGNTLEAQVALDQISDIEIKELES